MAMPSNMVDPAASLEAIMNNARNSASIRRLSEWAAQYRTPDMHLQLLTALVQYRKVATSSSIIWLLEAYAVALEAVPPPKIAGASPLGMEFCTEALKTAQWAWRGLQRDSDLATASALVQRWVATQLVPTQSLDKALGGRQAWHFAPPQAPPAPRPSSGGTDPPPPRRRKPDLLPKRYHYSPERVPRADLGAVVTPSPPCERLQGERAAAMGAGAEVCDGRWGGGGALQEARYADVAFRMLKVDACAMIRHVGKAMRYGERAMLSAFHFFHHFHWVTLDGGDAWPPTDLPAVCLACLHLAGKAEDTAFRIEHLMDIVDQLRMALPPYGTGSGHGADTLAAGRDPTREDVVRYEYRILETRRFNTSVVHPSRMLPGVLERARMPPSLRDLVPGVFQTRAYTDCDLCLQDDPTAVVAAAVVYMSLTQRRGGRTWALPQDFTERLGVPWRKVANFVALLVNTAMDVYAREPVQTLLRVQVVPRRSGARRRSDSAAAAARR